MRGLHELVKSPAQHSTDENADAEISWNKNTSFLIIVESRPHAQAIGTGDRRSFRARDRLSRRFFTHVNTCGRKDRDPNPGPTEAAAARVVFLQTASGPLVATRLGGKHLNIKWLVLVPRGLG